MCETMASMPVEDTSSYVLTQDMIDAAMTEQFPYQDDIESEEELSSQEDSMDLDQDSQGSCVENTESSKVERHISTESVIINPGTYTGSSVLVIETGLDKSQSSDSRKSNLIPHQKNTDNSKSGADENLDRAKSNQESSCDDKIVENNIRPQSNSSSEIIKNAEDSKSLGISDNTLPILKKILSDKPFYQGNPSIAEIDLCESDTDDDSEDEYGETETIDDELKSVMESNLMAEVGITINKQTISETNREKTPVNSPPKIAVKKLSQITSSCSNTLQNNSSRETSTQVSSGYLSQIRPTINVKSKSSENIRNAVIGTPVNEKDPVQPNSVIQINKIAVPHQTFVNSQGHKMKCVYVRAPNTSIPLVINSNQPSNNNKNIQYVIAPQLNKAPLQVSPIVALTNLTKQKIPPVKAVVQKPTRMLTVAPTLQKPSLLQNVPPLPHQFKQDQTLDSIIKSLIFHNLKKPYIPPDIKPSTRVYACLDCKDRFLFQSSLNGHLARRSIGILYWCRICKVELQFFNRCVLLKHLRGHNNSIKHIDTTCIKFNPLPGEMEDNGVIQPFIEEIDTSINVLNEGSATPRASTSGLQNSSSQASGGSKFTQKPSSTTTSSNTSKQKTKTVNQIISECSKAPKTILLKKPNTTTPLTEAPKLLPKLSPKTGKMALYEALQKQSQSVLVNKTPALNVSQKPTQNGIQKTTLVQKTKPPTPINSRKKAAPTNTVVKLSPKKPHIEEVIDDDTIQSVNYSSEDEEVDVEKITDDKNTVVNKRSAVSSSDNLGNSVRKRQEKKIIPLKRFCSECGVVCLNISKHLNSSNRPSNPDFTCGVCNLILPSKCSLKIHLRVHMKVAPYKCPDCGKDFNTWEEEHAHLKFSCGHLAKCMRYMCSFCKAHFPSKSILGNHISSKHSRDIFKCPSCPVAFYNKPSLTKHMSLNHPGGSVEGMDYKQCSLCPKKLVQMDKFVAHVEEHITNNSILIYGYKCPMCSVVFANKMAFIIHQIKEKGVMDAKNSVKSKKETVTLPNILPRENENNKNNDSRGAQVSDSNSDFEDEPIIVRKYPEHNSSVPEKDPLSLDGWESPEQQRVKEKREELCIVCKKNLVVLLPGIDLNDQSLCCKQCVKPLDNIDSAVNGKIKRKRNAGKNVFLDSLSQNNSGNSLKRKRNTPNTVKRSLSCDEYRSVDKRRKSSDTSQNGGSPGSSRMSHSLFAGFSPEKTESRAFCEEGFGLDGELFPNKKKNRKKQNKIDSADQTHIQDQVTTSKALDGLVCSKCDYAAETRESFLEHISVHRTDPNAFQCLECGLCFVVLPSLERHLQMHHGIKDINDYTEKNKSSLPLKVALFEEDVDDNQCRVCKEMFDCSSSLEKHFRTHGMAFMNSLSKSP